MWSCFEGMGAALWSWFLVGSEGNVRHHLQQQQQQAQQLNSLCFYQNPEGTSSPGTACFWRSFRPSGPWCFAVSPPPARTLLWSCFEGMGAALWSWFLVGSEGNVRHHLQQQQQAQQLNSLCFYQNPEGTSSPGTACFWRSFRPSGPWCFAVSQPPARTLLWSCFEGMGAALWSWFLVGSEGNVRHHLQQQQQQAQQLNLLCFYQNPEGTSSPGTACFWRSFRPSGPWCFAVSQPPARTLLWSCFEGMGAALWSWFLLGSEGNVRHQLQQQQQQQAQQLNSLCFY